MSNPELKRILYVEDDPSIQIIAQLALQEIGGFELQICSSGNEALRTAAAFQPELLLLDVMMPGMDGPTTLSKLRELDACRNTPAIFMTAKVRSQEVSELKQHDNTIAVLAKPFEPMTLAANIRAAWQARQTHPV